MLKTFFSGFTDELKSLKEHHLFEIEMFCNKCINFFQIIIMKKLNQPQTFESYCM